MSKKVETAAVKITSSDIDGSAVCTMPTDAPPVAKTMIDNTISFMRAEMARKNMKATDVAKKMGTSYATFLKMLGGKSDISFKNLKRFLDALNITEHYYFISVGLWMSEDAKDALGVIVTAHRNMVYAVAREASLNVATHVAAMTHAMGSNNHDCNCKRPVEPVADETPFSGEDSSAPVSHNDVDVNDAHAN